jgi:uncharacterized membrane protein
MTNSKRAGLGMGIFLISTGIGHFIFPTALDEIVPSFIPGDPRLWTYLSGVAEISIGIGLLLPASIHLFKQSINYWSALSAFWLFVLVYPANINMAVMWWDRPMPEPLYALARLPLQLLLFMWAWKLMKKFKAAK